MSVVWRTVRAVLRRLLLLRGSDGASERLRVIVLLDSEAVSTVSGVGAEHDLRTISGSDDIGLRVPHALADASVRVVGHLDPRLVGSMLECLVENRVAGDIVMNMLPHDDDLSLLLGSGASAQPGAQDVDAASTRAAAGRAAPLVDTAENRPSRAERGFLDERI